MNTQKLKHVLFLDIDGVLTSDQSGTSYHCEEPENYHPDQACKANVLKVAAKVPELRVVVHSAWTGHVNEDRPCMVYREKVYDSPLNNVCEWLIEYDLFEGMVNSDKRDENGNRITKKTKILEWVRNNAYRLDPTCKLAIIDDDITFNELCDLYDAKAEGIYSIRFFPIDFHTGFTEEDADRVIGYFRQ